MFNRNSSKKSAERLIEEQIYAQVVDELSQGQLRDGLWGKALADSDGDDSKAKGLYIRYRVQSIVDESVILREEQRKRDNLAAEKARQNIYVPRNDKKSTEELKLNTLLVLGITFLPFIFSWVTLGKEYDTKTRIFSFFWLIYVLSIVISGVVLSI